MREHDYYEQKYHQEAIFCNACLLVILFLTIWSVIDSILTLDISIYWILLIMFIVLTGIFLMYRYFIRSQQQLYTRLQHKSSKISDSDNMDKICKEYGMNSNKHGDGCIPKRKKEKK